MKRIACPSACSAGRGILLLADSNLMNACASFGRRQGALLRRSHPNQIQLFQPEESSNSGISFAWRNTEMQLALLRLSSRYQFWTDSLAQTKSSQVTERHGNMLGPDAKPQA